MDGFNEKKWFIYVGDHHEGPFSLAELSPRYADGTLTARSYAWCEGQDDWKMLSDLRAFDSFLAQAPAKLSEAATVAIPVETEESSTRVVAVNPVAENVDLQEPEVVASAPQKEQSSAPVVHLSAAASISPQASSERLERKSSSPTEAIGSSASVKSQPFYRKTSVQLAVLALLAASGVRLGQLGYLDPVLNHPLVGTVKVTVSDLIQPISLRAVEKFPALGAYLSPIPQFADISQDDFEDLRSAAVGDVQQTGAKVAVAVSVENMANPKFYVTSNLPDGAVFDVYVEGIPATLLNHLSFRSRLNATLNQKYGLSESLKLEQGGAIPQGEYVVYVLEAESQTPEIAQQIATLPSTTARLPSELPQGRKIVAKKIYFLGGVRDDAYSSRLKEFHDRIRQKAESELGELKQFVSTLETQLAQSKSQFEKLGKGKPSAAGVKKWGEFHQQWSQLDQQLGDTFNSWTPEKMDSELFYGTLYRDLTALAQSVRSAHDFQNRYFTDKSADRNSLMIQVGEASSQSESSLNQLKLKIDQIGANPIDSSGLPTRI